MASQGPFQGQRDFASYEGWRGKYIYWDWRFQEGQGPAFDFGSKKKLGVFGTEGGGIEPSWRGHLHGFSMQFNGTQTGDSAGRSNFISYGTQRWPYEDITWEGYLRFFEKRSPISGDQHRMFGHDGNFEMVIQYSGTQWEFSNDVLTSSGSNAPITKDDWHHVICTNIASNGANTGEKTVWIDGVKLFSATGLALQTVTSGQLRIGHRQGGDDWDGLAGEIAFIRVYRRSATDAQIEAMFRNPFPLQWQPLRAPLVAAAQLDTDRQAIVTAFELQTTGPIRQAIVTAFEFESTDASRKAIVTAYELESTDAGRQAIVTAYELEAENAPRQAIVTAYELEGEPAGRQAIVTAFELEAEEPPRQAIVTAFELEGENPARQAIVTAFELEAEPAGRQAIVTAYEMEAEEPPRQAIVTAYEFAIPDANRQAIVTAFEFEAGNAPRQAIVTAFEFQTSGPVRRAIVTAFELEGEAAARQVIITAFELEGEEAPARSTVWERIYIGMGIGI